MCLFNLVNRLPSCLKKAPFCFSKVIRAFLKLYSTVSNEIGGGNRISKSWGQISGFKEVDVRGTLGEAPSHTTV